MICRDSCRHPQDEGELLHRRLLSRERRTPQTSNSIRSPLGFLIGIITIAAHLAPPREAHPPGALVSRRACRALAAPQDPVRPDGSRPPGGPHVSAALRFHTLRAHGQPRGTPLSRNAFNLAGQVRPHGEMINGFVMSPRLRRDFSAPTVRCLRAYGASGRRIANMATWDSRRRLAPLATGHALCIGHAPRLEDCTPPF